MRGYRDRMEFQYNLAMLTAWHAAALSRAKKIPPLQSLLFKEPKKQSTPRRQTWQEQKAIAQRWINHLRNRQQHG
jgi:hypothetical protein